MKTFKLKIITLAFGTVFLSSCTKLLYTSLDVLRPVKVAFNSDVNNILIITNTCRNQQISDTALCLHSKDLKKKSIPIACRYFVWVL